METTFTDLRAILDEETRRRHHNGQPLPATPDAHLLVELCQGNGHLALTLAIDYVTLRRQLKRNHAQHTRQLAAVA